MMRNATVMAALLLAGCGEREVATGTFDAGEGKTGEYAVTEDETRMRIETGEGEIDIRSGPDVAASLPAGLPLYPGATVETGSTITASGPGGGGALVSFRSDDPPDRIVAFYRRAAERAGYAIEAEMTMGTARMLAGRGDEGGFNLTVQGEDGGSTAMLTASRE